jgi:hypothetical protein
VGQFDARQGDDVPVALAEAAVGGELTDDRLDVAGAGVVGDPDRPVAAHGRPPDQLDRRQLAVAEERVGVEVVEPVRHRAPSL